MKVKSIRFLGVRTDQFVQTAMLLRDVMGLDVTRQREDLIGFTLGDGTTVEVYGPGDEFHDFFGDGPVVGFLVDDFDEARDEMVEAGVQFIGPPQHADGTSWNHFYGPDRNVYEIIGPGGPDRE